MFEQDGLGEAVTMLSLSAANTPASSSSAGKTIVGCAAPTSSSSSAAADDDDTPAPDYCDDPLEVQIRTENLVAVDQHPGFHMFPSTWQALYSLLTSGKRAHHSAKLALLDMPYAESEETSAADTKNLRALIDHVVMPGGVLVLWCRVDSLARFKNMMSYTANRLGAPAVWLVDAAPLVLVRREQRKRPPKAGQTMSSHTEFAVVAYRMVDKPGKKAGTKGSKMKGHDVHLDVLNSVFPNPRNSHRTNVISDYKPPSQSQRLRKSVPNDEGKFEMWRNCGEKSVQLNAMLIMKYTNVGDTVFDCFAGTASSALAAFATDRQWFGCEMDEDLHDDAKARLGSWLRGNGTRIRTAKDVETLRLALTEAQITDRPPLGDNNVPPEAKDTVEEEIKRLYPDGNVYIKQSDEISVLSGEHELGVFMKEGQADEATLLFFWGRWTHVSQMTAEPSNPGTFVFKSNPSLKNWGIRGDPNCPATKVNDAKGTNRQPNCAFVELTDLAVLRNDNGSMALGVRLLRDVRNEELLADYGDLFDWAKTMAVTTAEESESDSDFNDHEEPASEEPTSLPAVDDEKTPAKSKSKDKSKAKKKSKSDSKAKTKTKAGKARPIQTNKKAKVKKSGKEEREEEQEPTPTGNRKSKSAKKTKPPRVEVLSSSEDEDEGDYSEHSCSSNSGGDDSDKFARTPPKGSMHYIITLITLMTLITLINAPITLITRISPICRHSCQQPPTRPQCPGARRLAR